MAKVCDCLQVPAQTEIGFELCALPSSIVLDFELNWRQKQIAHSPSHGVPCSCAHELFLFADLL